MGADTMIEFNNISKFFGSVIALKDVTMHVKKGEIMCLLGDNGAGKSTLIKTLSGVHKPDEGEIIVEGKKITFDSPREALDLGIATVYQDLALVSLMSVARNFFMGREPAKAKSDQRDSAIANHSASCGTINELACTTASMDERAVARRYEFHKHATRLRFGYEVPRRRV